MPRVPRWMQLARDAAYHVITRGHNREVLFADPEDTRYFLGLLDRYRRRFGKKGSGMWVMAMRMRDRRWS